MNFDEFCKSENMKQKQNNFNEKRDSTLNQKDKENMKQDVNNLYNKYKDLSQNELMEELLKQTAIKKQNGTLTNQGLEQIKNNLAPYLNEEQNKNLKDIIERLK